MAIYHLSTNTVSRGKGKSVIGACAYRTASKMYCERTGTHHDYTRKQGVIYTADLVVDDKGLIQQIGADDRHTLWNSAEVAETRKDGRTGREIIINLPHELPERQRQALAVEFTQNIIRKYKVAATVAIHAPDKDGDQRNHHAHILMTTRQVTLDIDKNFIFGDKTDLELSNTKLKKQGKKITQEQIKDIRHSWAIHCNRALENNGIDARIDHRSHADRGLEQLPTVKMGHFATEMERKGITTARGDKNRAIKEYNVSLDEIAAIKAEPPPAPPAPTPKPKPKPAPATAQPIVHHAPAQQPPQVIDWFTHRETATAQDIEVTVPYSVAAYEVGSVWRSEITTKFALGHHAMIDGRKVSHGYIKVLANKDNVISTADWDNRQNVDLFKLVNEKHDIKKHIDEALENPYKYADTLARRGIDFGNKEAGALMDYWRSDYFKNKDAKPAATPAHQPQHQPQRQNSYDYDR